MGSTDVPEFCLRWNNHHSVLVSVLDTLLERERLVDVTLAAEGQFVNVHRLVLFACSQYFEDLLSQQPDKPAVIFLKDVRFADLRALVDYMYKGEVNVAQDQLAAFLQTAESLKIKGLVDKEQRQRVTSSLSDQSTPTQQQKGKTRGSTQQTSQTIPHKTVPIPVEPTKAIQTHVEEELRPVQASTSSTNEDAVAEAGAGGAEVEAEEHLITMSPKREDNMDDSELGMDDRFEATEHWSSQDAEEDGWSNSHEGMSGTSATDNTQANPSSFDPGNGTWTPDDPGNPTAGPSHRQRKSRTSPANLTARGWGEELQSVPAIRGSICVRCTCGKVYNRKSNYNRHKRYECGGKAPTWHCRFADCGKRFLRKEHLKAHYVGLHKCTDVDLLRSMLME